MPDIEGVQINKVPQGRVQRKVPKPFSRPSVAIGGKPEERREWRNIPAHALGEGDVIPDLGLVTQVDEAAWNTKTVSRDEPISVHWTITVTAGENNTRVYNGEDQIWCFTKPENQ